MESDLLSADNIQPHSGAFLVFLYALYGAYIESLFILTGDKGGYRSADFLLFVIFFLLLCLSDFGKQFILRMQKNKTNLLLVVFMLYLLLKVLFVEGETQSYYLGILFSEIGVNFIAGFIAFSVLTTRMPLVAKIINRRPSAKTIAFFTVSGALIFAGTMLYFLTSFLGTSLLGILQLRVLPNDFYQDFGDYITIAYCCLVCLHMDYFRRDVYSDKRFAVLVSVLIAEAAIAFVCLQVVNSNKSVTVIMLVLVSAIWLCKPKHWLMNGLHVNRRVFLVAPIILVGALAACKIVQAIDLYQFRIFDYGESESLLANSSILVRWQLVQDNFMDQFMSAPLLGDLTITNYMHSSLLSLQTHLGILGSLLIWSFVLLQMNRLLRCSRGEGLKAISFPVIITSIISSFFSWGPLWFFMGALYAFSPKSSAPLHGGSDQRAGTYLSPKYSSQADETQVTC